MKIARGPRTLPNPPMIIIVRYSIDTPKVKSRSWQCR